jgi:2-desacetyl-2-hydroxyethyl bacteriochlorophyllide A dehydrogenase
MKVRALWIESPRQLSHRFEQVSLPQSGEVLIKALYSGISAGTELMVYRGEVPQGADPALPTISGTFGYPIKYFYALLGEIQDVGPGVTGLEPTRRVFVHHPHQEAFCIKESLVYPLPDGLEPTLGIFAANMETALNGIWDAKLAIGETVVVLGLGIVGLLSVGLAKASGAERAIGVDPLPSRRLAATLMGADGVFGTDNTQIEALRLILGEQGADLIIEASGNPSALDLALTLTGLESRIVVLSWYGKRSGSLHLGESFHQNRVCLKSSQVSFLPPNFSRRWDKLRRIRLALKMAGHLDLGPLISHTFPFVKAKEGFSLLDERPQEALQVVLSYD